MMEAPKQLMQERIVIMIAHRLPTIRGADTVIVSKDSVIAEQRFNDELIARGGLYAEPARRRTPSEQRAGAS